MSTMKRNRSVLDFETDDALLKALQGLDIAPQQQQNDANSPPATVDSLLLPSDSETLAATKVTGSCSSSSSLSSPYVRNNNPMDWVLQMYDSRTTLPNSLKEEYARLKVLKSYLVLDTDFEPALDAFTREAVNEFNVSWAYVSFVDLGRQWYKSMVSDDDVRETPRQVAFCAHTILQKKLQVMVVPDTLQDPRFCANPLVTQPPYLRFYAGAPLIAPEGCALGSLCVTDNKPHPEGLSPAQQEKLAQMAACVVEALVQRRDEIQSLRKRSVEVNDATAQQQQPYSEDEESVVVVESATEMSPAENETKRTRRTASPPFLKDLCYPFNDDQPPKGDGGNDTIIARLDVVLPDPKTSGVDPDTYLIDLVHAIYGVTLKIQPALELEDYFPVITEKQMAAYNVDIVSATRENNVMKLKDIYYERGRDSLDCFNRFGEGLLNMACRRGFKDIARFLLQDVGLDVRIRDDYGRTPLHDACWHPEPQLDICTWIIQRDPSLFLVADKRGYTPFQYARKSDWHVWRQFLFDRRHDLKALTEPSIRNKFS